MITLSILIPSYNHAHFIIDTLNSHVENNTFSYEIIIIDDGSKDNSVEVIQGWINQHPEINTKFIARENRGVTATFNQLIDLAQGKYIRLFGSDDLTYPKANEEVVNFLEDSGKDAAFGFARVIDEKGKLLSSNSIEFLGKNVEDYLKNMARSVILKWCIVGPSLILRKSVFEKIGKFNEKSLIEDWYLYLNLISRCNISFLNRPVADYRVHSSNTSRTTDKNKRIKNFESQIMSGEECLRHFTGKQRFMLKAEISFLNAKKSFIMRNFVKCFSYLVEYTFCYFRTL